VSLRTAAVIAAVCCCILLVPEPPCRLNPPEEGARTQLRRIRDGQERFRERHGRYGTLAERGLVGTAMRLARRDGYRFEVRLQSGSWSAAALPLAPGTGLPTLRIGPIGGPRRVSAR